MSLSAAVAVAGDHPRSHVADYRVAEIAELGEGVPDDVSAAANALAFASARVGELRSSNEGPSS